MDEGEMQDTLSAHYDGLFSTAAGELYEPLSGINLAAHHRRIELLDKIELPALEGATVVDYGVGSWGFGCIFPKLKQCSYPIGIDVSAAAIRRSAEVSGADPDLAHTTVRFMTSNGYRLDLPSGSVDVFFCGECIEHVEDTDGFLTEIHRVIRDGGMVIFTTPNASPYVYRQVGLRWCVGFEHVALMDYAELVGYVSRFFDIRQEFGFNQTLFPGLDESLPGRIAEAWVRGSEGDPMNSSSLILVATRRKEPVRLPQQVLSHEWHELSMSGEIVAQALVHNVSGGRLIGDSTFKVRVPPHMDRCNVIFWCHDWSGYAQIDVNGVSRTVNLYSHVGGCIRLVLRGLCPNEIITISATGIKDARSIDSQVILYRVVFGGAAD